MAGAIRFFELKKGKWNGEFYGRESVPHQLFSFRNSTTAINYRVQPLQGEEECYVRVRRMDAFAGAIVRRSRTSTQTDHLHHSTRLNICLVQVQFFFQVASNEILESHHGHELLDEQLRVEHGNVSGTPNQRVGIARQCMVHVVPDQIDVGLVHNSLQNVPHHLLVGHAMFTVIVHGQIAQLNMRRVDGHIEVLSRAAEQYVAETFQPGFSAQPIQKRLPYVGGILHGQLSQG